MRKRSQADTGATLLVVLVVLLLISVISLGMLSFASASFQTTSAVRAARQQNYAADGAVELGIRRVLADSSGSYGLPAGPACGFSLVGANALTSSVRCAPDGNAGAGAPNRAANAILTLAPPNQGIVGLHLNNNLDWTVGGPIFANSSIQKQTPSTVTVAGAVTAGEASADCSALVATPVTASYCGTANPPTAGLGADPNWVSAAGTQFSGSVTPNPAPYCTSGTGTMGAVFSPGKYTMSPVNLLGSGCPSRRVLYFLPGVYYFEGVNFDPGNLDVVAGTAAGTWLGSTTSAPPFAPWSSPPTDGTACSTTAAGVQFILGTNASVSPHVNSSITVNPNNNGKAFSMCAGPAGDSQPAIAIYGVKNSGSGLTPLEPGTVLLTGKKPDIFIDGAIYTPKSNLDISFHLDSHLHYTGGLVAYTATVTANPSTGQTTSPIGLPPCSVVQCRSNRRVIFTSSIGGVDRIRAVVDFNDGKGATPGLSYTVASWSVLR